MSSTKKRLDDLQAAAKPPARDLILFIDRDEETGLLTVNGGEPMTEAEFDRRYPGPHKVIGLGIDLSEI